MLLNGCHTHTVGRFRIAVAVALVVVQPGAGPTTEVLGSASGQTSDGRALRCETPGATRTEAARSGAPGGADGSALDRRTTLDPSEADAVGQVSNARSKRSRIHIPIGIPNTVDTLKTFVEADGSFSPGFGTYGVYFWVYDREAKRFFAPTQNQVAIERGLAEGGYLVPWSRWRAGDTIVRSEVCQVATDSPLGAVQVVAARATLGNTARTRRRVSLYVALRPLGPAGGNVGRLAVADGGDALVVDGRPAIVARPRPDAAGVTSTDTIGAAARENRLPDSRSAESESGDCSGALRWDITLEPGGSEHVSLICPVLPGRRAVGHNWGGKIRGGPLDLARLNPADGGRLQPDPGLDFYRGLSAERLFDAALRYWRKAIGTAAVDVPDRRWGEALRAITAHIALAMNEGAPDVSVINYNVFNRDGVYMANVLQKSGRSDLAAAAIDYFLAHPFSGRAHPEADNPGQILWVMGEHWRITRDRHWLRRVYPSVRKLTALVRYYRATDGPHYVSLTSLDFGEAVQPGRRRQLQPGRCDGHHPEYTEAFDIAGLRAAIRLAGAVNDDKSATDWRALSEELFKRYDRRFAGNLGNAYGSYCVFWPCRLYRFDEEPTRDQFAKVGKRKPSSWRYFALAEAHQGLLAGRRDAGWATLDAHLDHEQMRGWYAFDEGGRSNEGDWSRVRTTWNARVAMPHGWAVAEFWLLMRDSLLFEDGDQLVLLAGVPKDWLDGANPLRVRDLPTWFGPCSFTYSAADGGVKLELDGRADPPGGFVLRLPAELSPSVDISGKHVDSTNGGDFVLPRGTRAATIRYARRR